MVATLTISKPIQRRASAKEAISLLERIRRMPADGLWPDGFDTEIYLVERWKVFAPGFWNGETWTSPDVRDMVENFRELLKPRNSGHPFLIPIVNEQHDIAVRYGWVVDVGEGADGWLWVTLAVNRAAAQLLDSWLMDHSSIEFFSGDQIRNAGIPPNHPDGRPRRAVLRAVALTGGEMQAVLGQPPAPRPYRVFNQTASGYRSFTARIGPMDLNTFLQQLQALIASAQGGATDPAAPPADPMQAAPAESMMGADLPPMDPNAMNEMPAGAAKQFTSLYNATRALAEQSRKTNAELETERKRLAAANVVAWETDVNRFVNDQKAAGRINPNDHEARVRKLLLKTTDPEMQKELREEILSRPANRFTQRMVPQPTPTGSSENPKPGSVLPSGRTVEQLLALVPAGKKFLEKQKAASN